MQDNQKTKMPAATDMLIEMTHLEQHGNAVLSTTQIKHSTNTAFNISIFLFQQNTTSFPALFQPASSSSLYVTSWLPKSMSFTFPPPFPTLCILKLALQIFLKYIYVFIPPYSALDITLPHSTQA